MVELRTNANSSVIHSLFFPLLPLFYCLGNFPKASYISTSVNAMSSVGKENLMVDTYSFRMNGTNGASPTTYFSTRVFDSLDDEYGGVVVNPERLPSNPSVFASILRSSLSRWKLKVLNFMCFNCILSISYPQSVGTS